MNWNIRHDDSLDYVHAYQSGNYSVDEEGAFLMAIFASPFWIPGKPLVIDYSALSMDNFSYASVEMAKFQFASQSDQLGKSKVAFVCDTDDKFGVGRQLQTLVQFDLSGEVGVFRDERTAIDWVTCPHNHCLTILPIL